MADMLLPAVSTGRGTKVSLVRTVKSQATEKHAQQGEVYPAGEACSAERSTPSREAHPAGEACPSGKVHPAGEACPSERSMPSSPMPLPDVLQPDDFTVLTQEKKYSSNADGKNIQVSWKLDDVALGQDCCCELEAPLWDNKDAIFILKRGGVREETGPQEPFWDS